MSTPPANPLSHEELQKRRDEQLLALQVQLQTAVMDFLHDAQQNDAPSLNSPWVDAFCEVSRLVGDTVHRMAKSESEYEPIEGLKDRRAYLDAVLRKSTALANEVIAALDGNTGNLTIVPIAKENPGTKH